MTKTIHRHDPSKEYFFEEGCHIVESLNSESDEALSIARARVSPGQQTKWHALLDTVERYVILDGIGLVEVGDEKPSEITPGDIVVIPAGVRQRIKNTGSEDLLFLAICTPRFRPQNYIDLSS